MSKISERFVILRRLQMVTGGQWYDNTTYGAGKSVPGRVLDLVKHELLLHFPDLDPGQVDEAVKNIVNRLYRPEEFDMDKAMEADEHWTRGMYRA